MYRHSTVVHGCRSSTGVQGYSTVVQELYRTTWVLEKCRVTAAQELYWYANVQEK